MIESKLEELGFIIKRQLKHGLNRVATQHKPDKRNGTIYLNDNSCVYMSFDESIEPGYFMINDSLYRGMSESESQFLRSLSEDEYRKIVKQERDQKLDEIQNLFAKMKKLDSHPYLSKKLSHVDNKLRLDFYDNLVIPMYNLEHKLTGYQMIKANGEKRFKAGSQLLGSFFPILATGKKLKNQHLIMLTEGYATGSSVYQAIGACVVVCFSSNNIQQVKNSLRRLSDNMTLVVIHDNDSAGLQCCNGLGITVGGSGQDANDVHVLHGLEELKIQLKSELRHLIRYKEV